MRRGGDLMWAVAIGAVYVTSTWVGTIAVMRIKYPSTVTATWGGRSSIKIIVLRIINLFVTLQFIKENDV